MQGPRVLLHSQALDLGDCIGMESSADMLSDAESKIVSGRLCDGGREKKERRGNVKEEERKERKYPPPLPSLARTENLLSHMPWVLKRYRTSDGRLIIREEKVRHHEYFRAHRANGRLTLLLVPLDNGHIDSKDTGNDEVEDGEAEDFIKSLYIEDKDVEDLQRSVGNCCEGDGKEEVTLEEDTEMVDDDEAIKKVALEDNLLGGDADERFEGTKASINCFDFINRIGTSHCNFGIPVPAMKPVHI